MRRRTRRGMVLVLVLVVIALLTLASLTFSEMMLTERKASVMCVTLAQSRASADSGIEYARYFMGQDTDTLNTAGGWYNNPQCFQGQLVASDDDARRRSRFAIVTPTFDDQNGMTVRFGLEDESTKLNLNALMAIEKKTPGAGRTILEGLPGMTDEIADAILDWLDEDDEQRENGAEVDYYAALSPGYAPANGPLTTVEDLLLVRGVTPTLLFGCDANRNGLQDPGEPSPDSLDGVDNSDGAMSRGWSAYLTLYSMEKNVRPDGTPRININQDDLQTLYDDLNTALGNPDWATFIVAYRQNGPYTGTKQGDQLGGRQIDPTQKGTVKFTTVLDLIGAKVQVQFSGDKEATVIESPFPNVPGVMNVYLPSLMDNLTVNPATTIPGRINVNQAPRAVLAGIPGMSSEMFDAIISQREPDPAKQDTNQRYETWLLADGVVSLDEMKTMMPYLCGGGAVFRAQVVGYSDGGGPAARIEAILDTTAQPAKVLFWRDLTHLGRGYPVETLGISVGGQ